MLSWLVLSLLLSTAPLAGDAQGTASAGGRDASRPGEQDQQRPPRHTERVEVTRVLIDARAVDDVGQPILGLSARDFAVKIDGKPARVESAVWVGGASPDPTRPEAGVPASSASTVPDTVRGRLIVFLFQKDMEPSRIFGLMRMLIDTRSFLDTLGPGDRVAVLSFDYKLKIWLDFTNRFDLVRDVLLHGILFRNPAPVEPVPAPSLLSTLDVVKANRAYSMEASLALLGQALEPLPGSKSVVLVGHGFGRLSGSTLYFEAAYGEARRALQAARASVFCLDVTDADSHTLEAGLEVTAADTGGFYARTHLFPAQAMRRLAGALAGHYVLFVEAAAPSANKPHEIEVTLTDRKVNVLAKRHYTSTP